MNQPVLRPRLRLAAPSAPTIPGLEGRPDLQARYERELREKPGCGGCARTALLRKYRQLAYKQTP